uniref:Uncharacterized protein n=1 Tax=Anguilla anguilla TaxID=7936 RepID=A0A0E9WHZ1_ANGAN
MVNSSSNTTGSGKHEEQKTKQRTEKAWCLCNCMEITQKQTCRLVLRMTQAEGTNCSSSYFNQGMCSEN